MFLTGGDSGAIILGRTEAEDMAFLLATEYNNGRIFLTSGHPEVTRTEDCNKLFENAILWVSKQK